MVGVAHEKGRLCIFRIPYPEALGWGGVGPRNQKFRLSDQTQDSMNYSCTYVLLLHSIFIALSIRISFLIYHFSYSSLRSTILPQYTLPFSSFYTAFFLLLMIFQTASSILPIPHIPPVPPVPPIPFVKLLSPALLSPSFSFSFYPTLCSMICCTSYYSMSVDTHKTRCNFKFLGAQYFAASMISSLIRAWRSVTRGIALLKTYKYRQCRCRNRSLRRKNFILGLFILSALSYDP